MCEIQLGAKTDEPCKMLIVLNHAQTYVMHCTWSIENIFHKAQELTF